MVRRPPPPQKTLTRTSRLLQNKRNNRAASPLPHISGGLYARAARCSHERPPEKRGRGAQRRRRRCRGSLAK
jgi:hypothetical protein